MVDLGDPKQLLDLSDRVKSSLHDAAVVLGTVREGRPHLIASLTKSAVEKGLNAADIIRAAAEPVGGRAEAATRWLRPVARTRRSSMRRWR